MPGGNVHRTLHKLHEAERVIPDPGNGGTIELGQEDLTICELTGTGAETRILENPSKAGLRIIITVAAEGGDIVVTAANGIDADGTDEATFEDVGDLLQLVSVSSTSGSDYRWAVLSRTGTVAVA